MVKATSTTDTQFVAQLLQSRPRIGRYWHVNSGLSDATSPSRRPAKPLGLAIDDFDGGRFFANGECAATVFHFGRTLAGRGEGRLDASETSRGCLSMVAKTSIT